MCKTMQLFKEYDSTFYRFFNIKRIREEDHWADS